MASSIAAALVLTFLPLARATDAVMADAIFAAYNQAFYLTNDDQGFYRETTAGGKTQFWERAEQMDMVLDVYERTTNAACLTQFNSLYRGFTAEHGTNWIKNQYNDDIMWMVIACARASQFTGNPEYRAVARSNFDLCFARAWSTNLGGGLFWSTANLSKNSCVNGPGAIASYLLYLISGDTDYLAKARSVYAWERTNLFDAASGRVYDNINLAGKVDRKSFTYNEGTFIGAANFLGYTNDARRAADGTKNVLCTDGLLPGYGQSGDAAGFNGICIRWLAKFMRDQHLQSDYLAWLQANALAAWANRREPDDLSWSRWAKPTPPGLLYSWACSSAVVLLQAAARPGS
jgi:predicted alpha-1,6-mannanase (GH76 family)